MADSYLTESKCGDYRAKVFPNLNADSKHPAPWYTPNLYDASRMNVTWQARRIFRPKAESEFAAPYVPWYETFPLNDLAYHGAKKGAIIGLACTFMDQQTSGMKTRKEALARALYITVPWTALGLTWNCSQRALDNVNTLMGRTKEQNDWTYFLAPAAPWSIYCMWMKKMQFLPVFMPIGLAFLLYKRFAVMWGMPFMPEDLEKNFNIGFSSNFDPWDEATQKKSLDFYDDRETGPEWKKWVEPAPKYKEFSYKDYDIALPKTK